MSQQQEPRSHIHVTDVAGQNFHHRRSGLNVSTLCPSTPGFLYLAGFLSGLSFSPLPHETRRNCDLPLYVSSVDAIESVACDFAPSFTSPLGVLQYCTPS